jgi:hypothetical protein
VARSHSYYVSAKACLNGKSIAYTPEHIDIMVAYIVAEDAWYVVPVAAFAPRTGLTLFPSGCKRKKSGLFERYRDAWHLMKAGPSNRDLENSQILGHLLPR